MLPLTVSYYVCWTSVRSFHPFTSSCADEINFSYEYLWEDGVRYKRPTKLPAPEYVDALMNWAQGLLDDEAIFPNKIGSPWPILIRACPLNASTTGVPFPKNFRDTVKTIVRRLFRVYAHIYSNHFDHICALGIEGMAEFT